MSTHDETLHPRATDGKFATKDVTEAVGGLGALGPELPQCPRCDGPWGADQTCQNCCAPDGQMRLPIGQDHDLGPGAQDPDAARPLAEELGGDDEAQIGTFEHGHDALGAISLSRNEDGTFHAESSIVLGFREGLGDLVPGVSTKGGDVMSEEDAEKVDAWLDEHSPAINAWMADEYGVERLDGDDWDWQQATVSTDLPADASTQDLTSALESGTKAIALYNESDPGTYGSRDMWRELRDHLAEHDERVENASQQYLDTALWSSSDELVEQGLANPREVMWEDLPAQTQTKIREDVERFLIGQRHVLKATGSPDYFGCEDATQVGHDLYLSRNGHGAGFFDRGLGEHGDRLQDVARALNESSPIVGDDGNIYFE
ncbi:hypothetical protein ACFWGN_11905 [Oerskovia sp. NPDC060338]|uniref:hypothetical protein n=1 Tax=Oerskovia sp. NPDC060338 TaxID=3347100 RepID=UPI00365F26C2